MRQEEAEEAVLRRILALVVGVAGLASTVLVPAAGAATITPTVATDDITNNSNCTLREAVQASNTNGAVDLCTAGSTGAADTIVLNAGTYTLTEPGAGEIGNQTGDLDVVPTTTSPLTIVSNLDESEIDGTDQAGTNVDRVIEKSTGGGSSSLTLTRIQLDDGQPPAGESGGALRVVGSTEVTLNDSRVTLSDTDSRGGGMLVVDDLTLNDSEVTGNDSTETTGSIGAGISSNGDVTLNNSVIDNNDVASPDDANADEIFGAGIAATIGSLRLVNSSISNNDLVSADPSDTAVGGGIFADSIDVTIIGSTIEGNTSSAPGGFGLAAGLFYRDLAPIDSDLGIQNSTFSGNVAELQSGAVQVIGGDTEVRSSTFTQNTAGASRSIFYDAVAGSDFVIGGSILSENGTTECNGPDPMTSGGFNIDRGTTCALANTGDQASTNPGLLALADNGGPTETHAFPPGSLAIDRIPAVNCDQVDGLPLTIDQRSAPRPVEEDGDAIAECDVGAYELNRCRGVIVNVVGTFGADDITGAAGTQSILGLAGNDEIDGAAGDDAICAGDGDDEITEGFDGAGDDFDGGAGTDELRFPDPASLIGAKIDLAAGVATTAVGIGELNSLFSIEDGLGGQGPDNLIGDAGPNTLNGLANADSVTGNAGIDTLLGDTSNDSIFARDGGFDSVDCGDGTGDTAQLDQVFVDTSVLGCESLDFLPNPVIAPPPNQGANNNNQAKKKCKKGRKLKKGKCVKKRKKRT